MAIASLLKIECACKAGENEDHQSCIFHKIDGNKRL